MLQQAPVLSGARLGGQAFGFQERTEFDPQLVLDVLQGRSLGVIFRDVIPEHVRKQMVARFWESPARRHREGEPSHYVGAYHWNKPVETYAAEAAEVLPHVREVLDVPGSPWWLFHEQVGAALAREGAQLRVAETGGGCACPALVRAWDQQGEFALEPHEDTAQCRDPRQSGFEIQDVVAHEVCAVNMCIEHQQGGRLVVWNIRPDDDCRRRLGLVYTGFPYPHDALDDVDELRLDIHEGDVYVFNGGHVHAVDTTVGHRTNVSFLIGYKDDQTVVTWT